VRPGRLVIVRHGETEWSKAKKHTGRTDIPLDEAGRAQAAALDLPRLPAVSSPLSRALETARIAGFEPELDDGLVEWDYGEYEGLTTEEIRRERPGWSLWTDGCPGGECAEDVAARVDRVIERVADDTILFAHGHVLRVLTARWLEQPPAFGARLVLPTAGIGELGYERETRALIEWFRPTVLASSDLRATSPTTS
jgi:broad specificity phosphatase PhoE